MLYRFYICDVFTDQRFDGNPLAVLPEAAGLSDRQMQQIAREFNFSESTFVFPPEAGHTRVVRIFTPTVEVPFAGHPNIGTAFVLAGAGEFGDLAASTSVTFEEKAGLVPITIEAVDGKPTRCELTAPQTLILGNTVPVRVLAAAVSLSPDEIVTDTHPPQVASVGLPFVFAELSGRDALARARVDPVAHAVLLNEGVPREIHVYVRSNDEFDIRARVFAPSDGVPEDPATGSANCALAGMLAHYAVQATGDFRWRIAQGVEMGRPSTLHARAEKRGGKVVSTHIGGACVLVAEGFIHLD